MPKYHPPPDLQERLLDYDDAPLEGGYYDSSDVPAPAVPGKKGGRFTPELGAAIVSDIEQGAYLHVAAAAAGIKVATLNRWRTDPRMREFAGALDKAVARARIHAEHRVHAERPALWLTTGPGRDLGDPDRPGWTRPTRRVEGRHHHEHLHAAAEKRLPIDMTRLSLAEVEQLEKIVLKAIPPGAELPLAEATSDDDG